VNLTASSPLLAHHLAGQGEPLLLLNGGLMSMAAWEPIAAPLQTTHRVLRCDLRGQLLSPGLAPDLAGHLDEVVRLLDALALPAVHVAGTSFGAQVGLLLAARYPARVASLCAITATDRVTAPMWEAGERVRAACRAAAEGGDRGVVFDLIAEGSFSPAWTDRNRELLALRRQQVAGLPDPWFVGLEHLLGALRGLDLRSELPRIGCPTTVVAAALDLTFPLECSQALVAGIPGARIEMVTESGHALVVEQPDRLLEILEEHLAWAVAPAGRD
jgi:pimeloyl-ACP methyl ester carboxylesterase